MTDTLRTDTSPLYGIFQRVRHVETRYEAMSPKQRAEYYAWLDQEKRAFGAVHPEHMQEIRGRQYIKPESVELWHDFVTAKYAGVRS